MGRRFLLTLVVLLTTAAGLFAVQSGFQTMTIVRASQKTRDRVIYYVVNTPLYREDPYFEVEVSVNGTNILAEYEPRDAWEILPEPWKPGALVQGRVEGHSLFLKRPNGAELRFVIVKRTKPARKAK
jgi:hypothetical protein